MAEISIIIPVYNTFSSFEKCISGLKSYINNKPNLSINIIVVDDGSTNSERVQNICEKNSFKLISITKNKGKGNAIKTGINSTTSDYCIFTDADIPFSYESMDRLINELTLNQKIFVIGDRTLKESNYFIEINKKRKFISGIFTFIVNTFITKGIKDTQCGLKGFNLIATKKLFHLVKTNRFTFDVELIHIAVKNNIPITRIPVSIREHQKNSSVRLFTDSFIMLIDLIKIKIRSVLGKYKLNS